MERKLLFDDKNPMLSRYLAMFDHNRSRIMEVLENVTDEMLDYTPNPASVESIGTLLLHIAAVDWSWVFEDLDKKEMEYEKWKYAFALRSWSKVGQLTGKPKSHYIQLISETRSEVLERLKQFSDDDLSCEFTSSDGDDITFTLDFMLYHLINHEALHLGQISLLKRLYFQSKG